MPSETGQHIPGETRLLECTSSGIGPMPTRETDALAKFALDALSAHLAILDQHGTVIAVNSSWREFAVANWTVDMAATVCEGANYLQICEDASGEDSEEAARMAAGIRAVLGREQDEFTLEYPCHSPNEKRWFSARVTRFSVGDRVCAIVAHENITGRKQAEIQVASERTLLRTIIDHVPVAVYAKDAACRKVLVNSVDLANIGRPESEVLGRTDLEILPKEVAEACMADDLAVTRDGVNIVDREELITSELGESRWLLTSKIPWRDESGAIVGLVGIGHDITERRRAEDKLRDREHRLDFLLTSTPAVIYTCNAFGDFGATFVSENVQALLGYRASDYTSNPVFWAECVHPDDTKKVFAEIARVFAGEHLVHEYRFRHQDGSYRWLRDEVNLLRDAAGEPTEMIGFWIDITERKRAEEALQVEKDNLSAIFTASPVGLLLLDGERDIVEANAEVADLVSRNLSQVLGLRIGGGLGCVHSTEHEKGCGFGEACFTCDLRRGITDVMASGKAVHGTEVQMTLNVDGRIHRPWLKFSAERVSTNNSDHVIVAMDDVTERRLAEEALLVHTRQLEMLHEASQRLNSTLDLNEINEAVHAFLFEILPCDSMTISDFNAQTGEATCTACWREGIWQDVSAYPAIPLEPEGQGTQSIVLRSGKPLLLNDYQAHLKTYGGRHFGRMHDDSEDTAPDNSEPIRSAMIVPLILNGQVKGAIQVQSYDLGAYTEGKMKVLEALTLHMASARQNALLYSQAQKELQERVRAEEALRFKNLLLATQLETALDGILVVNETSDTIISYNQRFVEMWGISAEQIASGADAPILAHNLNQVVDPAAFIERVRYLNDHLCETSHDEFDLKCGRTFERYSAPMIGPDDRSYGRVWFFRDVTAARKAEEAVKESELRYRTLADSGQALIWTSGLDGGCDYFNQTWLAFTGRTIEEGSGNGWAEGVHPADRAWCLEACANAFGRREPFAMTYRMRRHDGEYRWIQDNGTPRYDSRGAFLGYIGHCLDITQRMLAEETLRDSEARYRAVTQSANDAIITVDQDGDIVGWNRGAETIFGYTESEITGQPVTVLMAERHRTDHALGFTRAASTEGRPSTNKTAELAGQRKDGSEFPLELSVSEWTVNNRLHFTGIIRDITERTAMQERMTYQAYHDPLTTLPNRVLLQDRLSRALVRTARSGKLVAVLFLDLDNFKLINDSLGHEVGDHLLVSVADRIQHVLRASDTAARFGGDEFTVLLEDIEGEQDACAVAARILAQFRRPITLATREVFVNASVGIALSSASNVDPVELMRNADAAMYAAKGHGRGRYEVFHSRMNTHALRRLEMESELRRAVERKELVLHYQPIISLSTGAVSGLEALVRWNHPTRGLIAPLDFIPLAEETGLILAVGRWILREACRQMQEWRTRYLSAVDVYVAVNLSALQFQQASLVDEVIGAIEYCALPPSCLTLEITESVVMEQTEFTLMTLAALKATGLRISIDDFGTGYSSLSYLRRFPVDYLKIDRSFTSGLGSGSEDGLIVSSTISLAHSLGLKVVAEGAESAEQVSLLRGLSCDTVQGFYFHPALPASQIDTLLARGTAKVLPAVASAPSVRPERPRDETDARTQADRRSVSPVPDAREGEGDARAEIVC